MHKLQIYVIFVVLRMSDNQEVPTEGQPTSDGFDFSFSHPSSAGSESYNITVETTYNNISNRVFVKVYGKI